MFHVWATRIWVWATNTMTGSQLRPVADGSTTPTVNERNNAPFQQVADDDSIPWLPEDLWCHIHSLMSMRAAARAACLSRAFLCSWRRRPNLKLNGAKLGRIGAPEKVIDRILRNHSGGLKTLHLDLDDADSTFPHVDSWLQVAVTPGIEGLSLVLYQEYNFPCSLLSRVGSTIQDLKLESCIFHPTSELGPLRRLTNVELSFVHVTGIELENFLSNSLALEQLELNACMDIFFLKIPCVLQRLSRLSVSYCGGAKIDCKAPNLSFFCYEGVKTKILLRRQFQMKTFHMSCRGVINGIPSIMPNLETIHIASDTEVVTKPMLPTQFLRLKHIDIQIEKWPSSPSPYDYFSLAYFFEACPLLETLILDVPLGHTVHESVFRVFSRLRQLPEHPYKCLKSVSITGFTSAKSLVELTCCIVKNAVSLECLTLDTFSHNMLSRCFGKANRICRPTLTDAVLKEAYKAAQVIRVYIKDKVAPGLKLTLLEPCTRCHSVPVDDTQQPVRRVD